MKAGFFGGGSFTAAERDWIERAVKRGALTPFQVRKTLIARDGQGPTVPLGIVAVSLGYLKESDLEALGTSSQRIKKQPAPPEEIVPIYGSCTVLEPLGRGPCGSVYVALHGDSGARVALKVIAPNALNRPFFPRFMGSVRHALALSHPAIVRVVDAGIQDGSLYVASSLVQGTTLAEFVRSNGPLAVGQAVSILRQVAEALGEAHAAGLVHGNLKPENVFITGKFQARITDFGLGRADVTFLKEHADQAGTIIYSLAPEQWNHEAAPASDLYACGVLWHFMLTGRFPFEGRSYPEIRKKHEKAPPPSVSRAGIPPAADALAARLLAKDPAARPAAADLVDALGSMHTVRRRPR